MRAVDVPKLVDALRTEMQSPGWVGHSVSYAAELAVETNPTTRWTRSELRNLAATLGAGTHQALGTAPLYYVADSMVEVAADMALDLDDGEFIYPETFPSPTGFLAFERPMLAEDTWGTKEQIAAVCWSPLDATSVLLEFFRPGDDSHRPLARAGMRFIDFRPNRRKRIGPHYMQRDANQEAHVDAVFAMMGTSRADVGVPDQVVEQVENPIRELVAILELMKETRLVSATTTPATRTARQWRGKPDKPSTDVVVIHLRRESDHGVREAGTGRFVKHQFKVRGHWRNQAYGPGWELRKRIYIAPFWKGDRDDPVDERPRVYSLDR